MQPGQPLRFQGVASRLEALRLVEHADVEVDPPHEARIGKADAAAAVRTERAVPAGAGGEGTRLLLGIGNLLDLVADPHGDRAAGRAPAGLAVALGDGARRSEERRGGKECVRTGSTRWSPDHSKKKNLNNN